MTTGNKVCERGGSMQLACYPPIPSHSKTHIPFSLSSIVAPPQKSTEIFCTGPNKLSDTYAYTMLTIADLVTGQAKNCWNDWSS